MADPANRYVVRSTNFSVGPRHVILDRELDSIIESFLTRKDAEEALKETLQHLGISSLSGCSLEVVR